MNDEKFKKRYENGKKCPRCKEIKPLNAENFYRSSKNKNGYKTYCKDCTHIVDNTKQKEYYTEYNADYYKAHKKEISVKRKIKRSLLKVNGNA